MIMTGKTPLRTQQQLHLIDYKICSEGTILVSVLHIEEGRKCTPQTSVLGAEQDS